MSIKNGIKKGWAIITTPSRKIESVDKNLGIVKNGENNDYPTRMERFVNNSVTAKMCANMYARFLIGEGFVNQELNEIVVGVDSTTNKKITTFTLLKSIAREFSKHSGVFIHVKRDGNLHIPKLSVVPSTDARFGKPDSKKFSGKVAVYDNWQQDGRLDKSKIKSYNIYDSSKKIINYQITGNTTPSDADLISDLKKWGGQIYSYSLDDEFTYPLSPIDVVQHDADSELQVSLFKNGELRRGFFAKHIIMYDEFEDDNARQEFEEDLKSFEGATEGGSYLAVEGLVRDENGNIQKPIEVITIDQNINDNLFVEYEKSFVKNIAKAYNNIPLILIEMPEGMSNTSGATFKEAVGIYNEQTAADRRAIEQIFTELMGQWKDEKYRNVDWTIKKLNDVVTATNNTK